MSGLQIAYKAYKLSLGGKDAPGRQRVQKTIDSLVLQSKDLVEAATALGITRLALVKPK